MSRNRLFSPREIEGLIADGQTIVIYNDTVLRLDSWLYKHPGGQLAIQHMVGRDATDEINVIRLPWSNLIPPLHGGVHRKYISDELPIETTLEDDSSDCSSSDTAVCYSSSISSAATTIDREDALFRQTCAALQGEKAKIPIHVVEVEVEGEEEEEEEGEEGEEEEEEEKEEGEYTTLEKSQPCSPWNNLSRAAYTTMLEQKEIDQSTVAYPSLDMETQQNISREYRALHERVKSEGFYVCRYSEYAKDAVRWTILFGLFLFFLQAKWYLTSACFLGMFWQQIMFVAHDAGHRGITGDFVTDTLIGMTVADFCCGLSIGWWKASHNVHHLVTNMPEHDPDLQNIPIFATSPSYLRDLLSTFYNFNFKCDAAADFLVRYQKWTYYPIMALARFNLYFLSWVHLMSPHSQNLGSASWTRSAEIMMMACYWVWYGYGVVWHTLPNWPVRVAFVLICHCFTMLLHVQITLSHWGMPTSNLGPLESFAQHQLRTTMDIECPRWLDFLHGGLQFQAVHHLFPRVPRHNLRALQELVREFCAKTQLEYKCHGFVKGNKIVVGRLEEVAKMAEMLVQCQLHMAETGESGLH